MVLLLIFIISGITLFSKVSCPVETFWLWPVLVILGLIFAYFFYKKSNDSFSARWTVIILFWTFLAVMPNLYLFNKSVTDASHNYELQNRPFIQILNEEIEITGQGSVTRTNSTMKLKDLPFEFTGPCQLTTKILLLNHGHLPASIRNVYVDVWEERELFLSKREVLVGDFPKNLDIFPYIAVNDKTYNRNADIPIRIPLNPDEAEKILDFNLPENESSLTKGTTGTWSSDNWKFGILPRKSLYLKFTLLYQLIDAPKSSKPYQYSVKYLYDLDEKKFKFCESGG